MEQIKRPCSNCRIKRIRCDKQLPKCQRCYETRLNCEYPPPSKANSRSKDKLGWNKSYKIFKMSTPITTSSTTSNLNNMETSSGNVIKDLETEFQIKTKISTISTTSTIGKNKEIKSGINNDTFEKLILYYSNNKESRLSPGTLQNPKKLMQLVLSSFRNSLPVWGSSIFRNQFSMSSVEVLVENLNFNNDNNDGNQYENSERAIYNPDNIFYLNLFNQITFKLYLIDLYFTHSHPFWPLFSKSKFFSNLEFCPPHLMYSICFAGYQHHEHFDIKLWQFLFNSSLININRVKFDIRLSIVKSCLITCRSIIHWGKLTEGWLLLSQGIKMAIALGLHTVKSIDKCLNINDYEKSLTWNMCLRLQYSFNNGKRRPPIIEFPYYQIPREALTDSDCIKFCSQSSHSIFDNLNYRFQLYSSEKVSNEDFLEAQLIMLNYKIERSYILPLRDKFLLLKQRYNSSELTIDELEIQQMDQYYEVTRIHLITTKLYKYLEDINHSPESLSRIRLFYNNYLIIYYSFINGLFSLHLPKSKIYKVDPLAQLIFTTSSLLKIIDEDLPPQMVDYRYYSLFISILNCVKDIDKFDNIGKIEVDGLLKGIKICFKRVDKKFSTLELSWRILDRMVKNSL